MANVDGLGLTRVGILPTINVSFAPDGTRVAYQIAGAIAIANTDGTEAQIVVEADTGPFLWNPKP